MGARFITILVVLLHACAVDVGQPATNGRQITCTADRDCPAALVCISDLGLCAPTGSACVDRAGDRYVAVPAGTACALDAEQRGICLLGNCRESRCGDGFTDPEVRGEECDAGAANSDAEPDACRSDCRLAHCGDGVIDRLSGEQCDDGTQNGDGQACSPECTAFCGDGYTQPIEACDDGNRADGDGCDHDCSATGCGNGIPTQGEECDDANDVDGDGCDSNCTHTACGNGATTAGEVCDDGNNESGDDCSADCRSNEECGNGIIDWVRDEGCDEGDLNSEAPNATCRTNCQPRRCGDGVTDDGAGEDCDGTPPAGRDCLDLEFYGGELGCLASCRLDTRACAGFCGDGVKNGTEACDGGDLGGLGCADLGYYGGDLACLGNCSFNLMACSGRCGDGVRNGAELCDGNDFGDETCLSFTTAAGDPRYTGALACNDACDTIDASACTQYCADGVKNGAELCDTNDFGSVACGSYGYYGGSLTCADACTTIDTVTCQGYCGDGVKDDAEQCDGIDQAGLSCAELSSSYVGGSLTCDGFCRRGEDLCYGERWQALQLEAIDDLNFAMDLQDVWSSADGHTFIVGEGGTLLHFDGSAWSRETLDSKCSVTPYVREYWLTAIWGASATDVYAVGNCTNTAWAVLHYDGVAWTASTSGTSEEYALRDIWGDPVTGEVFAVGSVLGTHHGVVLRRVAGNWETTILQDAVPTNRHTLAGVWGVHADDVYAVGPNLDGSGGRVRRFDGTSWSVFADNLAEGLMAIAGTAADNIYVAGGNGAIFHYDGATWGQESRLAADGFMTIWMPSASEVFVGGSYGTLVHLIDGVWEHMDTGTSKQIAGIGGPSRADVFAVGADKTLLRYRSPPWLRVEGLPVTSIFYDIDGVSMDDFFVVGGTFDSTSPKILRYLRGVWSSQAVTLRDGSTLTGVRLLDVDVLSESVAFAAGAYGRLLRWDGSSWTATDELTEQPFYGVIALAADHAYAVGPTMVYELNGTTWAPVPDSSTTGTLHKVWVGASGDIVVAGTTGSGPSSLGFVKRFRSGSWIEELSVASYGYEIAGLWGTSDGNLFASFGSAANGRVFHYDGSAWAPTPTVAGSVLTGIGGSSAGNVIAVGRFGAVARFDGSAWASIKPDTYDLMRGALTDGVRTVVVGGTSSGAVFSLDGAFARNDGGPCDEPVRLHCDSVGWGDTRGAGDHVSEYGTCGATRLGADSFFVFDNPIDGSITVSLRPYEQDLDLIVQRADSVGRCGGACEGSSAQPGLTEERVVFTPIVGQRYYLAVETAGADPSAFTVEITCDKR